VTIDVTRNLGDYVTSALWQLLPVFALAAVGWRCRDRLPWQRRLTRLLALAPLAGLAPFLVRASEQYWLLVLPFLAALAAGGLSVLMDAESS